MFRRVFSAVIHMNQKIILSVTGMTCGGCVNSVTRVLQATPGVVSATVTLLPSQAVVEYDTERATSDQLSQAIKDAGFSVVGVK